MPTLGQTKSSKKIDVVDVVRHGDQIVIPEGMTLERVDAAIHQKIQFEDTVVAINATIAGFVTDAAYATYRAMNEIYGWVNQIPTPGFFGDDPPAMIDVQVSRTKSVQVPFGRFQIANINGYLEFGVTEDQQRKGVASFVIGGQVKRKDEAAVMRIVNRAREILRDDSIYKGEAIKIRLKDERGRPLPFPTPQFIDLNPNVVNELIFPQDVMLDISINLFTPIEHTAACRKHGIPLKRGILLAGDFGVGKTMAAHATAVKCVENGWTYIVCLRADELADVLRIASELCRPCVVFCEDIDRVMSGERDISTDDVLNVIDGVESKGQELMIVLTTNDIDNIEPALLRPGRLDAVIYVDKPDAEAAERLARQYGRGLVDDTEDLSEASALLAGRIPAVIREAVERSKLGAIFMADDPDGDGLKISNAALLHSARRMQFQLDKLEPKLEDKRSETVKAAHVLAEAMGKNTEAGSIAAQPVVFPVQDPKDAVSDAYARDAKGNIAIPEE